MLDWKKGVVVVLIGLFFVVTTSLTVSAASCIASKQITCDSGIVCPNEASSKPNCVISTNQEIWTAENDVYYFNDLTINSGATLFVKSSLAHSPCPGCTAGAPEKYGNWGGYGGEGGNVMRKGENGFWGSCACGDSEIWERCGGTPGAGGGYAGGYIGINANTFVLAGRIAANGANGATGGNAIKYGCGSWSDDEEAGAGGGGGGSGGGKILVTVNVLDQKGGYLQASGGSGAIGGWGACSDNDNGGGAGGGGAGGAGGIISVNAVDEWLNPSLTHFITDAGNGANGRGGCKKSSGPGLDGTPGSFNKVTPSSEFKCNDGIDNDVDTYTDMEDPDCQTDAFCPVFQNFNPLSGSASDGSDGCCGDDAAVSKDWGYCTVGNLPSKFWGLKWVDVECIRTTPPNLDPEQGKLAALIGSDPKNTSMYAYFDDISVIDMSTNTELVTNGNFETGTDQETRDQWGLQPYGDGLPRLKVEGIFTINKCAGGDRCAVACQGCWQFGQDIPLKPSTTYKISYKAAQGSADSARLAIFTSILGGVYPGRDLGYVDTSKQHLCALDQDKTDSAKIIYTPEPYSSTTIADWVWLNAKDANGDKYYKFHTVGITDFVSNTEEWNYCDPYGRNNFNGNSVGRFETVPRSSLPSYCICESYIPGFLGECNSETVNEFGDPVSCCESIGPSCEDPTNLPQSFSDCGVCYDGDSNVVDENNPIIVTSSESTTHPDTSSVLNPDIASLLLNPSKSCTDNGGKNCSGGKLCVSDEPFTLVNSNDTSPPSSYCCIEDDGTSDDITCEVEEVATCASQSGEFCPAGEACGDGYIIQASDAIDSVCCESVTYCFDPRNTYTRLDYQPADSMICYEERGAAAFAECCNELTADCYNGGMQQFSSEYPYDRNVFGVGTPIHSIFSFEKFENNFLRTRVIRVDGPTLSSKYGPNNLAEIGQQNFGGFSHIIFSMYFSVGQSPVLHVEDNDGNTATIDNLLDYSVNGNQPGKWHRIIIHLKEFTDRGINNYNMKSVRVSNLQYGVVLLDNFYLDIDNNDKNHPYAQRYCSGYFKEWVDDFEPDFPVTPGNIAEWGPYKDVCNYNFFGWTGNKCCGDDQTTNINELYQDTLGGCWNGDEIYNNNRLAEAVVDPTLSDIIYFNGAFQECQGTRSVTGFDGTSSSRIETIEHPIGKRLGAWVCTLGGSWEKEGYHVRKTSRVFLAAKLYEVSDSSFTLACDSVPLATNDDGTTTNAPFVCVLNNDPHNFASEKAYIGIAYDDPSQVIVDINGFVPFFNDTSTSPIPELTQGFIDNCSVSGDSENFTTCGVLSNTNGKEFHAYHNSEQKVFIFGHNQIKDWHDETFFEVIWNAIKGFFVDLFTTEARYYAKLGFEQFGPEYTLDAEYEHFYLAQSGDKQILGTFETDGLSQNNFKVTYSNFEQLNLSEFVDAVPEVSGISVCDPHECPVKSYIIGCNESVVYMQQIDKPETYWNFFTSNIKINDKFTGTGVRLGNCTSFCGDGQWDEPDEACDYRDPSSAYACEDVDTEDYRAGSVTCSNSCEEDFSGCIACGDVNRDGVINDDDVIVLEDYLFKGGSEPSLALADIDGDSVISIKDTTALVTYLASDLSGPACITWPCGTPTVYFEDSDNDGYGDIDSYELACTAPTGFVSDNTDCDDTNGAVNPGASEIPNNKLNDDCDDSTPDVSSPVLICSTHGDCASDEYCNPLSSACSACEINEKTPCNDDRWCCSGMYCDIPTGANSGRCEIGGGN